MPDVWGHFIDLWLQRVYWSPILKQLEFMDCGHCGKRVAKTARRCGHCGFDPTRGGGVADHGDERQNSDEHHAEGGYDAAEDDFDYDEFVEEEFGDQSAKTTKRNLWWYVALFFLILYSITALFPIVER